MENKFNLVEEKWVPIQGGDRISLIDIFQNGKQLNNIGGNPIEKISIFKFLLAVVHSAYTPKDNEDWRNIGIDGMSKKVLEYLDKNKNLFYLYGEKPFLQFPKIAQSKKKNISILEPYKIPTPKTKDDEAINTTVLTEIQKEVKYSDSEKSVLLITNLNFALGGKKVDNSIILTKGYEKTKSAKSGYSLGRSYLHSFILAENILKTIYINWFSQEQIKELKTIENIGTPPWEKMPQSEDDEVAKELKKSYLGMLVPFSRFILIDGDYINYTEGFYPTEKDLTINRKISKGKEQIVKADPNKKPWRELISMLSFVLTSNNSENKTESLQLKYSIERLKKFGSVNEIIIYSGGLNVTNKAGEDFVSGDCDFVESEVKLNLKWLGDIWFNNLKTEMKKLDSYSKILWSCVNDYYLDLKDANHKEIANKSSNVFWQLMEKEFNNILEVCNLEENKYQDEINKINKKIFSIVCDVYDGFCPKDSAKQIESWIKSRPNFKREE